MNEILNLKIAPFSSALPSEESHQCNFQFDNYSAYLIQREIPFSQKSPYLVIGDQFHQDVWLIHISIVKREMINLLDEILDFLVSSKSTFTIPENNIIHGMIIDGSFGYMEIGKVITIYPETIAAAITIAQFLIVSTAKFHGPEIPASFYLKNCIYTSNNLYPTLRGNSWLRNDNKRWPFKSITGFVSPKSRKWLNNKYFKLISLKNDAKGNVYKGLNFTKWSDIRWCVIKQGKKYQCADDAGRDVRDRLKWQYKVQSELAKSISLPKPVDFIEVDGDAYFIMEFIEGASYNNLISSIQEGVVWHALPPAQKGQLIQLALQVIEIVKGLHSRGYVHRDLSPVNFIVTPENKIYAIDIELCYNVVSHQPDPFFTFGTAGFMSPAQLQMEKPSFADDIYGIGAILTRTFTGFSPTKLNVCDAKGLFNAINYCVDNMRLSDLICACLSVLPENRPDLSEVKRGLEFYLSLCLTGNQSDKRNNDSDRSLNIDRLIKQSLHAITHASQINRNGTWYAKTIQDEEIIANYFKGTSWYPGFYAGVTGVLYTLTISGQYQNELGNDQQMFTDNFNSVVAHFSEINNARTNPGLYFGTAGFAVVMSTMIKRGLLENSIQNINKIAACLSVTNPGINLSEGISGNGIAMIKCAEILGLPKLTEGLPSIALKLTQQQNSDGSWLIKKSEAMNKGITINGLLPGIAGIVYFLLIYGKRYNNEQSINAAIRGLNYLIKNRRTDGTWSVNQKSQAVDPWFEFGFTGIAFLFIKACQYLDDPKYKDCATIALLKHPKDITSNYVSQANGLAGLGEVYLEAYKVFKEDEWKARAECILNFFRHSKFQADERSVYWLDGSDETPFGSFMLGNAGIIHFLLRFKNLQQLNFPLIGVLD